jgi:Cu2+-exporting ATPase
MLMTYHFYLPDAQCASCIAPINQLLSAPEFYQTTGLQIKGYYFDKLSKEIKINVAANDKKTIEVKNILLQNIREIGFNCIDLSSEDKVEHVSLLQRIFSSHWVWGSVGIGSGLFFLLLCILSGGWSLPVMIVFSTISSLLTLILGAPFYYQAVNKFIHSRTLTMDMLFTISTLTVIAVSLAAFAFPWLPMILDAGPLIFGFRHLGLAIEKTLIRKMVVEKKFRDRLPLDVNVVTEEGNEQKRKLATLQADDIVILKPGEIVPIDGEVLNDGFINDSILTGSILPRAIHEKEKVLAGMRLAEDSPIIKVKATPIIVLLKAGEVVPAEGFCMEDCTIAGNESNTLVPMPRGALLAEGACVASPVRVKVLSIGKYSYLHRLDKNNEKAQFGKAPIEEATDKVLQYFIPTIFLMAVLSGLIISLFFPPAVAIQCAVAVLVTACPCTLGLITPLAVKIGINKAIEHGGVQFKSAKALQAAAEINAVVFDLNGTFTTGIPTVKKHVLDPTCLPEKDFLSYLAAAEEKSKHPIAESILAYVKEKDICALGPTRVKENDIRALDPTRVVYSDHSGIKISISKEDGEDEIIVGSQSIMDKNKIDLSSTQDLSRQPGQSIVYLARNGKLMGYMILMAPLRPHVAETLAILRKSKIKIFLCTGADKATAEAMAQSFDIPLSHIAYNCIGSSEDEIVHSQTNEVFLSKVAFIKQKSAEGYKLAMVGDGANDAAAVAANFGIAIRSQVGDEITQQQADAIVQSDTLLPVANAFAIATETVRHIKQNLIFSLIYNVASVILAGGLLVAVGISISPAVGAALMILQTSLVLANAYRFKQQKLEHLSSVLSQNDKEYNSQSYNCLSKYIPQKTKNLAEENTAPNGQEIEKSCDNSHVSEQRVEPPELPRPAGC